MGAKKRYKGTIKFFSYERGYGFLVPHDPEINEDGKLFFLISVFFHFSSISTQPGMVVYLLPQQICEFELVKGPRGYLAKNVTSEHKTEARGQKTNDIYYHYYHSFRKIMSKMIEDEIDKMKENKKCW